MIPLDTLATFFGWCTVINTGVLLFSTVLLISWKEPIMKIHAKLFDLDKETLALTYFQYLGNYKVVIYVLNLVPYVALKIMT